MGAANALKVYHSWRHLDDRPFRLLSYMALRARDNDAEPWYGAGHDELALIALGLEMGTEKERLASLRAVSRAMQALAAAGAIKAASHARPGKHAVYRLFLGASTYDGGRRVNGLPDPVDNPPTYDADRRVNNPEHTTPTVVRPDENVRRSVAERTTLTVVQRRKEEEVGAKKTLKQISVTAKCGRQLLRPP